MKWNIICDSGCDLFALEKENKDIAYKSVPFYITIEDKGFNDNETLDTEAMIKAMKESKEASSTACPSPGSWKEEMNSGENNICITSNSEKYPIIAPPSMLNVL